MSSNRQDVNLEVASELFETSNGGRPLARSKTTKSLTKPERRIKRKLTKAGKGDEKVFFDSTYTWWTYVSKAATCCFTSAMLNKFGIVKASEQAWREKVTLCLTALIMSIFVLFFILFFSRLVCPIDIREEKVAVNSENGVIIRGVVYNYQTARIPYNTLFSSPNGGFDASFQFTQPDIPACAGIDSPVATFRYPCEQTDSCLESSQLELPDGGVYGLTKFNLLLDRKTEVDPAAAYEWSDIESRKFTVYNRSVLNLGPYVVTTPKNPDDEVDRIIRQAFEVADASHLFTSRPDLKPVWDCVSVKYNAGVLLEQSFECVLASIVLAVATMMVISILLIRFGLALIFGWCLSNKLSREPALSEFLDESAASYIRRKPPPIPTLAMFNEPEIFEKNRYAALHNQRYQAIAASERPIENFDLYTAILVTCYSEGEESIRGTLDSLAQTVYDDRKKLLFIVCDGLITGEGNPKSTPEMLIDMIEVDRAFGTNPKPYSYVAVAADSRQHNMAQVYCGHYRSTDPNDNVEHLVPVVLIVKCGTNEEEQSTKPGNRGKRDSQVILMNFFSRVILNDHMTPLDFDLFRKIHYVTGVTADFYETVLMVDADTRVERMSLRLMTNAMHNEPNIMGLCGETKISNKNTTWVTRIQVFEYYISHHLGKAFESVFGAVTCLPGCFSMYRIKSRKGDNWVPILVAPEISHTYSSNVVDTLHQKNLLLLGEDRFLSTVMLRTFPHRQMVFVPKATCKTIVPEDFKTLLSQRRRWINSTIHNLMELLLVNELCGTFCFSMQFIVAFDLIGTATLPVSLFITYFLIFRAAFADYDDLISWLSLVVFVGVIMLPAFLILLTRFSVCSVPKVANVPQLPRLGWFAIYLLALPVWQLILPLWAFWHFDDFSWGDTRKVQGDKGGGHEEGKLLDASTVPLRRWEDYEKAWRKSLIKKRQSNRVSEVPQPSGSQSRLTVIENMQRGSFYVPAPRDN